MMNAVARILEMRTIAASTYSSQRQLTRAYSAQVFVDESEASPWGLTLNPSLVGEILRVYEFNTKL